MTHSTLKLLNTGHQEWRFFFSFFNDYLKKQYLSFINKWQDNLETNSLLLTERDTLSIDKILINFIFPKSYYVYFKTIKGLLFMKIKHDH